MTDIEKKAVEELAIVREILGWKWHDDDVKHYFTKSFLLHWTTAEYIHKMTERDNRNTELRTA